MLVCRFLDRLRSCRRHFGLVSICAKGFCVSYTGWMLASDQLVMPTATHAARRGISFPLSIKVNVSCPGRDRVFQGQVQNEAKRQCRVIRTYQPRAIPYRFNKLAGLYSLSRLAAKILPVAWPLGSNCVNKHSAHSFAHWSGGHIQEG
jgi:hypothetical protein